MNVNGYIKSRKTYLHQHLDSLTHWHNRNYSRLHRAFQTPHSGLSRQVHYIAIHTCRAVFIHSGKKPASSWNLLKIIKVHENACKRINLLVAVEGVKWEVRVLLQGKKRRKTSAVPMLFNCSLPESGLKVLSSFLICC